MALVQFGNNSAPYLNAENLNNNFEYLDNKKDVYSTDEVKTNKEWIDGKPIYRKIFNYTTDSSVSKQISANILNVDKIIKIDGYIYDKPVNFYISNDYYSQVSFTYNTAAIYHTYSSSYQNKDCSVILEYTKTTD